MHNSRVFVERVPPLAPQDRDERQAELVRQAGNEFGVYTTLVRAPDVFADFMVFARRMLRLGTLTPRDRELLILRAAWRSGSRYEWSHHDVIGRRAGLTDEDLAAASSADLAGTDDATALLLRAADELIGDHVLSDATWAALSEVYPVPQIIEICLLVGEYAMLAGALNSMGVQIEPGYAMPAWDSE
jgi:4-carboxymuconolactone decarboxylase